MGELAGYSDSEGDEGLNIDVDTCELAGVSYTGKMLYWESWINGKWEERGPD